MEHLPNWARMIWNLNVEIPNPLKIEPSIALNQDYDTYNCIKSQLVAEWLELDKYPMNEEPEEWYDIRNFKEDNAIQNWKIRFFSDEV